MNTQLADKATIETLKMVAKHKGYKIFENDTKDFNLNIWNIRANEKKSNAFNDITCIFWKYNGMWHIEKYAITTDPGTFYLKNMINPQGTAILKPNQYINCWALGLHKGKYKALVQVKPVTTIRDFDKDEELDYDYDLDDMMNDKSYKKSHFTSALGMVFEIYNPSGKLVYRDTTGLYGINFHNSGKTFVGKLVNNWSAGCQVFYSWEEYWNKFIPLLQDAEKNWGTKFSITLIDEKSLDDL
jgi:hypothetical protein